MHISSAEAGPALEGTNGIRRTRRAQYPRVKVSTGGEGGGGGGGALSVQMSARQWHDQGLKKRGGGYRSG